MAFYAQNALGSLRCSPSFAESYSRLGAVGRTNEEFATHELVVTVVFHVTPGSNAMFKKSQTTKTSAPLRNSDRRKLKQRILESHPSLTLEDGDLLVPDGLLSAKFITHLDEQGVVYSDASTDDPLWFTFGRSDELIPTVYTLWKKPDLLPSISTPAAVIPILVGGSDLMIPGVIQFSPNSRRDQLVCVTVYSTDVELLNPPLAIGKLLIDLSNLSKNSDSKEKGKAVKILHTWDDHLYKSGSQVAPPKPRPAETASSVENDAKNLTLKELSIGNPDDLSVSTPSKDISAKSIIHEESMPLSPSEVSDLLRGCLLQAIASSLSTLSNSSYPISASVFYDQYILPSRPASCSHSHSHSSPIDIKHSSHKSLTAFLKSMDKEGLIKLKDIKPDGLVVMSVSRKHNAVITHALYPTLRDLELKATKATKRDEQVQANKGKDIIVRELWKPHLVTTSFFSHCDGADPSALFTIQEIKTIVNGYITRNKLINLADQAYVNMDELLNATLATKTKASALPERFEFLKRDELIKRIVDKMQAWYEITIEGREALLKKGALKPISVVTKIRQGRKASTLVTGFEPFGITPDFLADELRMICASSTSVAPVPGIAKTATSGGVASMEVLVQGKHLKAVETLLMGRGVPKRWIGLEDKSDGKK